MKKMLLAALACLLLLVSFSACGAPSGGDDVYLEYAASPVYSGGLLVRDLAGYTFVKSGGSFAYLTKAESSGTMHAVYHIGTGKVVHTLTSTKTVTYSLYDDFFIETQESEGFHRVAAYRADGATIVSESDNAALPSCLVYSYAPENKPKAAVLGHDFYKIEGAEWTRLLDTRDVTLPNLRTAYAAGGLLHVRMNGVIYSYDAATIALRYTYTVPQYVKSLRVVYLENGSFFVQTTEQLDVMSEDYNYIDADGNKMLLKTSLVRNGEAVEVDCDYLFSDEESITPSVAENGIYTLQMGDYDAVTAATHKIENGRLVMPVGTMSTYTLGLRADGSVQDTRRLLEGTNCFLTAMLPNGFYIVKNDGGQSFLYHPKGGLLIQTPAFNIGDVSASGKLYVAHAQKAYELIPESGTVRELPLPMGYQFERIVGEDIILSKELENPDMVQYYRYKEKGTPEYLGNDKTDGDEYVNLSYGYGLLTQEKNGRVWYHNGRNSVFSYDNDELEVVMVSKDRSAILLCDDTADPTSPVYYRVTRSVTDR